MKVNFQGTGWWGTEVASVWMQVLAAEVRAAARSLANVPEMIPARVLNRAPQRLPRRDNRAPWLNQ
jgi:hypothetical protein